MHQKSSQAPQMTPTDLKTPDTSSEASLSQINPPIDFWSSLSIPSNLHWSPINLLWCGTCPSNDYARLLPGFLVLPCHQYDSLPFAFLVSVMTLSPFRNSSAGNQTLTHSSATLQSLLLHRMQSLSAYSNYVPLYLWLLLLSFCSDYLSYLVPCID